MTVSLPLRFSTLKAMALSPAHFAYACTHELEPSRALRIGTATHAILLGGDVAIYDGTRRGKAWEAFESEHAGTQIVTADEWAVASDAAASVRADPVAGPLFAWRGVNETRIDWQFRGVPFRSTPDRVLPDGTLIELKTARTAEPAAFQRDAMRRHYHAQLAVYREALASQGVEIRRCVIVAVETVAPYCVSVHELDESVLELGFQSAVSWLERYQVCAAADQWPGYAQSAVPWRFDPEPELDFDGVEDAQEAAQ